MYGYHGRVMVVDLDSRSVRWEPLGEDVLRRFIGGTGLTAYLLTSMESPAAIHCPLRTL